MPANGEYRLIEFRAENFKRIKAVRIRPDKSVVRIEGRNGQGKSSVLDAIIFAIGGMSHCPPEPVRRGTKKSTVVLDANGLRIVRSVTAGGSMSLEVTMGGEVQRSPQAILDRLVSDLTFDPLTFVRMKPAQQADEIRRMAGIDFAAIDRKREAAYTERTIVGRDLKQAQAVAAQFVGIPSDLPATPVSVAALAEQRDAATRNNAEIERLVAELGGVKESLAKIQPEIDATEAEFSHEHERIIRDRDAELARITARAENAIIDTKTRLKLKVTAAQQRRSQLDAREVVLTDALAAKSLDDVSAVSAAIADAERVNSLIGKREQQRAAAKRAHELEDRHSALARAVDNADAEKADALAKAKIPYAGLSLDGGGKLTLGGVPFEQASSSEQLRASVAIGLGQKRPFRIMLIRDGSLLDAASLVELEKIAQEHDAQVIVERVADAASPTAVVIEDGEVVEEMETVNA